jgi:hypothetical protein
MKVQGAAILMLGLALTLLGPAGVGRAADPAPVAAPELSREDREDAETGKKASEEIEKEFKVVENPPDLPRLQGVVTQLRPATERPDLQYTLKVLDSNAINAFSLPGGYIYFTKGLLGAVESDDELAAVTAHEMAHVCLRHARRLMEKDEKYNRVLGSMVLAALLLQKEGVNPGGIATIGSWVKMERVNHYGREAELEADRAAIRYLNASGKYNPVGVLTVVEGLARMDVAQPRPDQGAAQTHPLAEERVTEVTKLLGEMKVPIERGRVTKGLTAMAAVVIKGEREIAELRLSDRVVFQPAVEVDGLSPLARAQQSAETLNPMLLANLELVDITRVDRDGYVTVRAKGETVLKITPGDAAFHGVTVEALARQAMQAMQMAFQAERVKRAY